MPVNPNSILSALSSMQQPADPLDALSQLGPDASPQEIFSALRTARESVALPTDIPQSKAPPVPLKSPIPGGLAGRLIGFSAGVAGRLPELYQQQRLVDQYNAQQQQDFQQQQQNAQLDALQKAAKDSQDRTTALIKDWKQIHGVDEKTGKRSTIGFGKALENGTITSEEVKQHPSLVPVALDYFGLPPDTPIEVLSDAVEGFHQNYLYNKSIENRKMAQRDAEAINARVRTESSMASREPVLLDKAINAQMRLSKLDASLKDRGYSKGIFGFGAGAYPDDKVIHFLDSRGKPTPMKVKDLRALVEQLKLDVDRYGALREMMGKFPYKSLGGISVEPDSTAVLGGSVSPNSDVDAYLKSLEGK